MKKLNGYYEDITIDGEDYTVVIIRKGNTPQDEYHCYLVNENGTAVWTSGFRPDQTQAKEPKIYSAKEIMELAMFEIEDYVGDIRRIEQFQDILMEHFIETDCIRAKNAEIYG